LKAHGRMKLLFRLYHLSISPVLHAFSRTIGGSPNAGCRFEPTCSVYAEESIKVHGFIKGGRKALFRLLRCQPFSGGGGFDPV
jgi:putative membrane protein insertion efficiency factor